MSLLVACGGDQDGPTDTGSRVVHPLAGCEAVDATPCDVRETDCQTRLFSLAACIRGAEDASLPPVTVLSEAAFAAQLNDEASTRTPRPHLETWDWALSSLKLIRPGDLSTKASVAQNTTLLGRYYPTTKSILVIDHGADFDAASASPILLHEMIHALQDRESDIAQFMGTFDESTDSGLAARAVIEGEARLHETRYRASALGLDPAAVDWKARFENVVDFDETYIQMQPNPLTVTSVTFPYDWGARYLYDRWQREGTTGVADLFVAPPRTTRVLMASTGGDVAAEALPERPPLPNPPPGWSAVDSDVLGAWGLFVAMSEGSPRAADNESVALQWRSDVIGIYENEASGGRALVWRIEVADAPTTTTTVTSRLAGLAQVTVRTVGTSIVVAGSSSAQPLDWAFAP